MLQLLYQAGPELVGIFRLTTNVSKKPVMRKRLEEGPSPKLEELDGDDLLVVSLVMKVNYCTNT